MTQLERLIRDIIAKKGPISLEAYMELALQHPDYGYYRVREPLGRTGDFVTAPEVSQMFGEMIGVWCAEAWRLLGKPDPFALIELGPGWGTMMKDILRATTHVHGFHAAKHLCLIDSDKLLRQKQQEILGNQSPKYFDDIAQIPPMPSIIVANEFFDSLPVRQFEKTFHGWSERKVLINHLSLVTGLVPLSEVEERLILPQAGSATPGTVVEISPQSQKIMGKLAHRLATNEGAALILDYGYVVAPHTATVQAVSKHSSASILDRPGEIDLTAHVDFGALAQAAREGGAEVLPVVGQGEFLKNLGIDIRANTLKKHATPTQASSIHTALNRLIDETQMGTLFKVMEVRS